MGSRWWEDVVFYEVYIRSFEDSNGDGVGDLNGITARLDYLEELGVDALWITPFYPSPQVDNGYDISDHEGVDGRFGTLDDFDRLLHEAHRRGLRVILDIVLNHTSDQHPWFVNSRQSRDSPYREWYIWRDGAGAGAPPNNWESAFGGPAWSYDTATGQWYYHFFYKEQPDLNWRNPDVERRMFATLDFWLRRGVDGFRLDAVNTLYEDPGLPDNPTLATPRQTITGVYTQEFAHNRRLPEVHDALKRARAFVERRAPDAVLISEAYVDAVEDLACFYGDGDEMHMPFNFFLAQVPSLDAALFRQAVEDVERACVGRWPSLVLSNHDIARACDRYADPHDVDAVAKLLATMMLTLRGTPFLYYGEEIAMRTEDPVALDEVRDPVGRVFWPRYKGRDGSRRRMKWEAVRDQSARPDSVFTFYRSLLKLRREHVVLREGTYRSLIGPASVLSYAREAAGSEIVVVLNMSNAGTAAQLPLPTAAAWRALLGTARPAGSVVDVAPLVLEPFEALVIARVT